MVEDSRWIVARARPQPGVQEGNDGDARKKDRRSERGEKDRGDTPLGKDSREGDERHRGRKRGWAREKGTGEKCDIE